MRVGVSMAQLAAPRTTGLERYSVELLRALRRVAPCDLEVLPYVPSWAAPLVGGEVRCAPVGLPRPLVNEVWVAQAALRDRVGLLHEAAFAPPQAMLGRASMTLHDLTAWTRPQNRSTGSRLYFTPSMERALRSGRLRGLATDATSTLNGARRLFGITAPGVVAPLGVDTRFRPGTSPPMGPPYRLLTVGTLEPRKGLGVVQEAAAALSRQGVDFTWRLVGRQGWREAAPAGLELLGPVDDQQLLAEYQTAHVLVAPSLEEGFDLPVLEGLACGTAVVATDIAVHREHYGSVVTMVRPGDATSLVDGVLTTLQSQQAHTAAAREVRTAHASRFTWDETARSLVRLWRQTEERHS